jgi:hypothetical protein
MSQDSTISQISVRSFSGEQEELQKAIQDLFQGKISSNAVSNMVSLLTHKLEERQYKMEQAIEDKSVLLKQGPLITQNLQNIQKIQSLLASAKVAILGAIEKQIAERVTEETQKAAAKENKRLIETMMDNLNSKITAINGNKSISNVDKQILLNNLLNEVYQLQNFSETQKEQGRIDDIALYNVTKVFWKSFVSSSSSAVSSVTNMGASVGSSIISLVNAGTQLTLTAITTQIINVGGTQSPIASAAIHALDSVSPEAGLLVKALPLIYHGVNDLNKILSQLVSDFTGSNTSTVNLDNNNNNTINDNLEMVSDIIEQPVINNIMDNASSNLENVDKQDTLSQTLVESNASETSFKSMNNTIIELPKPDSDMEISNNEEVHNTFIQNTEPSPEKRKRNYSDYDDNSQLSDVTVDNVDNQTKRQRMNTNPQENDGLYDDLYGDIYSDVDIGGKRKRKGNRQSKRIQVNSKKTKRIKNKKGIKYNKKANKITKKSKKHNKTSKRKMRR